MRRIQLRLFDSLAIWTEELIRRVDLLLAREPRVHDPLKK